MMVDKSKGNSHQMAITMTRTMDFSLIYLVTSLSTLTKDGTTSTLKANAYLVRKQSMGKVFFSILTTASKSRVILPTTLKDLLVGTSTMVKLVRKLLTKVLSNVIQETGSTLMKTATDSRDFKTLTASSTTSLLAELPNISNTGNKLKAKLLTLLKIQI